MGVNGENPRKILGIDSGYIFALQWSPTGRRIVFGVEEPNATGVAVKSVARDGKEPLLVFRSSLMIDQFAAFAWTGDGRLIFSRADSVSSGNSYNLWYLAVDPDTGVPSGEPVKLTHWDGAWPILSGLSKDSKRLIISKSHLWADVYVGELKDHGTRLEKPTRLTASDSMNFPSGWSRDGKSLLIGSDKTGGRNQIYSQRLGQEAAEALILGPDDAYSAELTPDGVWTLYWAASHSPGNSKTPDQRLMRAPAAGGASERILETPGDTGFDFHCAILGTDACVLSRIEKDQLIFYSLDPLKGQGKELARTKVGDPGPWMDWALSPDAKNIAVTGCRELAEKVRVIDVQSGMQRELPTPSFILGGLSWSADGSAIYGASQRNDFYMLRVDLSGKSHILLDRPAGQFLSRPRVSPDGRFLAYGQQSSESNVYLLENF